MLAIVFAAILLTSGLLLQQRGAEAMQRTNPAKSPAMKAHRSGLAGMNAGDDSLSGVVQRAPATATGRNDAAIRLSGTVLRIAAAAKLYALEDLVPALACGFLRLNLSGLRATAFRPPERQPPPIAVHDTMPNLVAICRTPPVPIWEPFQ